MIQTRLRDLGILITTDATTCTHLAAPHIVRTQKFICALAHAPVVLSTDFVDDCLQKDELLDVDDYILEDEEGEVKVGFKLADALRRARQHRGKLLQGYSVYCTEMIHGGFDTYKAIIESNGGKCLLYRARAGLHGEPWLSHENETNDGQSRTPEYVYLLSGTTQEESKLWPKFRRMVGEMGKAPRVVRTDWMLDLALSQEIQWREIYELTDQTELSEA